MMAPDPVWPRRPLARMRWLGMEWWHEETRPSPWLIRTAREPWLMASYPEPASSDSNRRAKLIARIRRQIQEGVYETPEKLEIALRRLLERLDGNELGKAKDSPFRAK